MKARRLIIAIALICAFYFLGYIRNYIFVTINGQASATYYNSPAPPLNGFMTFIGSKNYNWLLNLKWVLTLSFTVIYCSLSMLSVFLLTRNKSFAKISLLLYAFLLVVSASFMAIGYVIYSFSPHAYSLARSIMHLGQSPLITLLILAGLYFYKKPEAFL
jgi:hypothetical protein